MTDIICNVLKDKYGTQRIFCFSKLFISQNTHSYHGVKMCLLMYYDKFLKWLYVWKPEIQEKCCCF